MRTQLILNRIRQRRQAKGISQEYLAFKLNMSTKAYAKIERGETRLTVQKLFVITSHLDLSPSGLIRELELKLKPEINQEVKSIPVADIISFISKY